VTETGRRAFVLSIKSECLWKIIPLGKATSDGTGK
jgi:hypothetical protein